MLQSPDDRSGALGFGHRFKPPAAKRQFKMISDLENLVTLAERIVVKKKTKRKSDPERIRDLIPFRTSMGGSRPKVAVEDSEGLWLAKFNRRCDDWNRARLEHALLELAKNCGIQSARSRVVTVAGRHVLLVKRFDREKTERGYLRYRMISGYTALRTEPSKDPEKRKKWGYALLAEELRRVVSQPEAVSKELFRRMVFNALVSNLDDDPGSFSIISKHAGWDLSPTYDYDLEWFFKYPSNEVRHLKMNCGTYGCQANAQNLLSECHRFLLRNTEASAIIDAIENRVRNSWYRIARRVGVTEADCKKIADAFANPVFRENCSGTHHPVK